ncbi:hypothetical protein ACWDXD_24800 [Streptomyces sp. NPDC003314]
MHDTYRLTWTEDGKSKVTAVTFSKAAAKDYQEFYKERADGGVVEIVPVKPGE